MAKFKVQARVSTYCYVIVEADSVMEANEKAEDMDGGDFISEDDNMGDWDIMKSETHEIDKHEELCRNGKPINECNCC